MGAAVPLRTDFSAGELRQLAKRAEDVDQARRLLSLAAVLDGQNRKVATEIGAMDRQTLRDWVHRFNEKGPEGLVNGKAPGGRVWCEDSWIDNRRKVADGRNRQRGCRNRDCGRGGHRRAVGRAHVVAHYDGE